MQAVSEEVLRFAGFTLDLRRGCVRAGDREMELRPKSFAVLKYLVENAGRLIAKDELISAMGLTGLTSIDEVSQKYICQAEPVTEAHEMSSWVNMPVGRIL